VSVLAHALWAGLGLSVYLGFAFFGLLLFNPEIWIGDYPPDIRAAWGPQSPQARAQKWGFALPILGLTFAYLIVATIQAFRLGGGSLGFLDVAMHTFVMLSVFNVVDLVILDWLIFVRFTPKFAVLPGTEGLEGYDDYRFHFHTFLRGTAGIFVASLLVAAIALLF